MDKKTFPVTSYDHLSNLIGINSVGNIVISEYENSGQGSDHTDFSELSPINGTELYFYGYNGNPFGGLHFPQADIVLLWHLMEVQIYMH